MKFVIVLLIALLGMVQVKLWVGDESLAEVHRLEQAIAEQQQRNVALEHRNRLLAAEVRDLKEGEAAIEERARRELGMIHEQETFYQVVEQ